MYMYINAYFLTKFFKKHTFQAFPGGRLENHTKVLNSAHALRQISIFKTEELLS